MRCTIDHGLKEKEGAFIFESFAQLWQLCMTLFLINLCDLTRCFCSFDVTTAAGVVVIEQNRNAG